MAIGVFAISAILLANTGQVSSIGNAKSEARLAFDRLMNAFSLCDRNDLARLTSPEWTYIGLDGRMYTREEYLKDTRELQTRASTSPEGCAGAHLWRRHSYYHGGIRTA
jgi:hypothetical protein